MFPLGLLAKATTTATAMATARVLVACAGAAGVGLAGLLVRRRGVLATTVACGVLAVFPDAVKASSTLFLESWLVLWCLLGAAVLFEGDRLTESRRRLLWGGVCIGFAAAVKVWAAFPAVILLALLLPGRDLRRAGRYVAGVVAGFCVPVLPFAAIAPRAFIDNVLASQLHQTDVSRVSNTVRFFHLFGLTYLSVDRSQILLIAAVIIGFVLVCVLGAWLLAGSPPTPLEWFALGTTVLSGIAFMIPMEFYPHYAAFFAPFLALTLALPAARLAGILAGRRPWPSTALIPVLAAAAAVAIVAMAVTNLNRESKLRAISPAAGLEAHIPAGACVITDNSSFTIVSNRFISSTHGCTQMVDATGTDMALGNGHNALTGAGRYSAVQSAWMDAFRHAQYVFLSCGPPRSYHCHGLTNRRIPWTPSIWAYFTHSFRRVRAPGWLYVRLVA
jgi:hypothetical protein